MKLLFGEQADAKIPSLSQKNFHRKQSCHLRDYVCTEYHSEVFIDVI